MLEEMICHCCNSTCSRKDDCYRYAVKEKLPKGEACIFIDEEVCKKVNCFIIK